MTRSHVKYQIARDDVDTSEYLPQNIPDFQNVTKTEPTFWRKTFHIFLLISAYFILSIGLTFYNPWLYNAYGFNFPLGVVVCHLVIKFALSALIRAIRRCYNSKRINLPWQNIIYSIMVPGIASGVDIGLSNWALSLISISLVTMTKSTTIIFILGFSLLFKLEKKDDEIINILSHVMSLIPVIPATLKTCSISGGKIYDSIRITDWSNINNILLTTAAVVTGAILAFSMEVMEFLVVTYTSSLTLSISGICKEICTLALAFVLKGDQLTGLNFVGLLMCLGGIILHVVQKVLLNRKKAVDNMELQSKVASNNAKREEETDSNVPLLTEKSTSLINLLNAEFSSDEDGDVRESDNSTQILSDILQRREQ
ncbi:S35C2 protein, partial [Acromyrmex heyeri]